MKAINVYWNMRGGYNFVFMEMIGREESHFASYRIEPSIVTDEAPYKTPYQQFKEQRRWTDILLFPLLGMELVLKLGAATILKPYTYSRKKLKQATGFKSNLFWGAATLVAGVANLFITQPLMFLGNVCNHVRCLADGILNFIASPFTAAVNVYQNKIKGITPLPDNPIKAWAAETGEIALSSFKSVLRGIKDLAIDAVTGAICYGVSYATAGAAAPILVPAATALQTASLSAATSAAAVVISAASTSALAGFSNIVSIGIHGCFKLIGDKIKRWWRKPKPTTLETLNLDSTIETHQSNELIRDSIQENNDFSYYYSGSNSGFFRPVDICESFRQDEEVEPVPQPSP